jgi:hypothetical protein
MLNNSGAFYGSNNLHLADDLTWSTAYRTNLISMLKENTIQIRGSEV